MEALIGTGAVACSAIDIATLPYASGSDKDLRSDRVPWTLRPTHQLERNPVISVVDHIAKQGWRRIYIVDYHIDVPVVEQVSKGCAAGSDPIGQPASGRRWNLPKLGPIAFAKELR